MSEMGDISTFVLSTPTRNRLVPRPVLWLTRSYYLEGRKLNRDPRPNFSQRLWDGSSFDLTRMQSSNPKLNLSEPAV